MPQSVKEQALRLLERRDYGRDELTAKLVEKGAGPEEAAAVAGRMVELGYVNDANYASMVARHYAARGFGPGRVRDELRRRRVPREYWDDALGQLPDDGEAAYRCLCARLRGRAASPEELRRASAALSRRGFSWEEIRPALERYKSEFDSREEA